MSHKTTRLQIIINYQKKIRIRQASYFEKVTNQKVQRRENSTKIFLSKVLDSGTVPELKISSKNSKYITAPHRFERLTTKEDYF